MNKIADHLEPQFRQILEHHVDNGIISEELFRPRACDRGFVSLARAVDYKNRPMGEMATEEQDNYNKISNRSADSIGVSAITQQEFHAVHSNLDVYDAPTPNIKNHSKVDFTNIGNLDDVLFELSEMAADNIVIKNW